MKQKLIPIFSASNMKKQLGTVLNGYGVKSRVYEKWWRIIQIRKVIHVLWPVEKIILTSKNRANTGVISLD